MTRPTYMVIPCGADKAPSPAPAAELYTGSMFRTALAAADNEMAACGGTVLILSALHGLVTTDAVLAPYDVKMGDAGSVTAERVAAQAAELGIVWDARPDVYAMLPKAYLAVLDEALRADDIYCAPVYEACGGIGEQKHVCAVIRDAA